MLSTDRVPSALDSGERKPLVCGAIPFVLAARAAGSSKSERLDLDLRLRARDGVESS
jgi:hypothetical protein